MLGSALYLAGCSDDPASNTNNGGGSLNQKDESIKAADISKIPAASKKRTDTFVAGTTKPGGVFNPYFYSNGWDENINSVIFSSLVNIDDKGKPYPQLAEKWDISADNLTYTFHLRPDLKFSDGSPLTAEDVAFTLTMLHDPKYDGATDISLVHIKGGQAYKEGKADKIEGIHVIDNQTIKIETEEVNAQALTMLGGPVLSKAYYGKEYKRGNLDYIKTTFLKPIGSGPYYLEEYVAGQELRFKANPYYYEGKPDTEEFIYKVTDPNTNFQLFQTGETDYERFDATPDNFEQLSSLGFANIDLSQASVYGYIAFNNSNELFRDNKVKQAFFYGLDRKKIVDSYYQGYATVADVPASPVLWSYTNKDVKKYDYDLERAKKLLDEAGWKAGKDGIREKDGKKLKVTFIGSKTRPLNDTIIAMATENYKKMGVDFDAELLDPNALFNKTQKGDYDLAFFESSMIIDPHDNAKNFLSDNPNNISKYNNPKADELIKKGISTVDMDQRKEVYGELYKELTEDPPVLYVYYRKFLFASNARMEGLKTNPFNGISNSLSKAEIQK
ncbi:ABC transporter substrate-binding protein [Niallia sp. 01092]|uniref:ABC transporter substrate-binding protein n=1 Tax=unclassified Niallia TaxID=2837522 RepID=UPI003FD54EDC